MAFLAAAVLLLAGCAHPSTTVPTSSSRIPMAAPSSSPTTASTSTMPPSTSIENASAPAVQDEARIVAFTNCRGMDSAFSFPGDTGPGKAPGDWDQQTHAGSDVDLELYRCERVSWGPFERGPIQMVFETHNKFEIPPGCDEKPRNIMLALVALWIDDAELAAYVNQTYGAATHFAAIQSAGGPGAAGQYHAEWSFASGGLAASTIQANDAEVLPGSSPIIERMVWSAGPKLFILNLEEQGTNSFGNTVVTPGEMRPPTLYSEAGVGEQYAGRGSAYNSVTLSATIDKYGDFACTKPE